MRFLSLHIETVPFTMKTQREKEANIGAIFPWPTLRPLGGCVSVEGSTSYYSPKVNGDTACTQGGTTLSPKEAARQLNGRLAPWERRQRDELERKLSEGSRHQFAGRERR